jgi:hypothetical protein
MNTVLSLTDVEASRGVSSGSHGQVVQGWQLWGWKGLGGWTGASYDETRQGDLHILGEAVALAA